MIKHEQFNLNYSTKDVFTQKLIFRVIIHVNSKTLDLLFTSKYPMSVLLCEPEFHGHSRPHTYQNTIHFIIYETIPKNSPQHSHGLSWAIHLSSIIFTLWSQVLGPIKRPFKASNRPKHHKTLKQSVKPSRIKPLPHGVCRNSKKPESTRMPLRVEQLSFLARRISTVGSPTNLERSWMFFH